MKDDATLVAEGLHPKDAKWLQERVDALEGGLSAVIDEIGDNNEGEALQIARRLLEDDAPEISFSGAADNA